ncbi:MAG: hypothetical protein PHP39_02205, partial [Oscillospiraceae bacterium]|nr:hypothetical protein [Oscillospiraceae bacterium]
FLYPIGHFHATIFCNRLNFRGLAVQKGTYFCNLQKIGISWPGAGFDGPPEGLRASPSAPGTA